uniref:type IV inositol polyphosphate 5-phosphatase 3-like n=1 Tax=Erigeron canadensis TaxID=72917 RepID=UPI001CB934E5|nr:type IV inositol polyphosphate 5-phosphatase 3-like [Erigeron canadensis]
MHGKRYSSSSSLMNNHNNQHHIQNHQKQPPSRSKNQQHHSSSYSEVLWPRIVIRKWLNRTSKHSEYNADPPDDDDDDLDSTFDSSDPDEQEEDEEEAASASSRKWPKELGFVDLKQPDDHFFTDSNGAFPRSRRRKSETCRAQYIDAKELKVSVNTWNVGGKIPPEDLNIEDWIDVDNPADVYVIGFQEVIPLNAGNIFGAEDNRPVPLWENVIRGTLNKVQHETNKFKCYSNPSSPSRFEPPVDALDIEDEVVLETESEGEEEVHPFNDESNFDELMDGPAMKNGDLGTQLSMIDHGDSERRLSFQKSMDRVNCFSIEENVKVSAPDNSKKLTRILSGTERMGLCWPEPPLDLLAQCATDRPNPLKTVKSFKASKSFRTYASFKSYINVDNRVIPEEAFLADLDLDSTMYRKRRSPYVRIVSKQMVGIFITVWVRRRLRKHIQNVHVSAVGVGVMGYIGNKGSISVSMSIYQTLFCFICSHLTSGEREADAVKRNADVREIHKRTRFSSVSKSALPKRIENHDRIIWLGDLNYRLNLSYEKTRDLIYKNDWPRLLECDQLIRELRKGRAFDGWSEGVLDFPPTYKYEQNSEKYIGEHPKVGRRTPAWCDRILSFGKGIKQLSYRRAELKLSDHRPVTATYMIEVEVFSPKKLQKALTFTNAEIENDAIIAEMELDGGINCLRLSEDTYW